MRKSMEMINSDLNSKIFKKFAAILIRSSNPEIYFQIKEDLKAKAIEKKTFESREISFAEKKLKKKTKEFFGKPEKFSQPLRINLSEKKLFIPEPNLPQKLQYLKPIPSANIKIDIGKLNPLINDPAVFSVECNGPDSEIKIKTKNQEKGTKIFLNEKEIKTIIELFSKETKIPAEEGIFRVVLGNLSFSAIISEIVGSKFIIKKIFTPPSQKIIYPIKKI